MPAWCSWDAIRWNAPIVTGQQSGGHLAHMTGRYEAELEKAVHVHVGCRGCCAGALVHRQPKAILQKTDKFGAVIAIWATHSTQHHAKAAPKQLG